MQTIDVVKTGIDRNFLRKCEDIGIISPHRVNNGWIRCEEKRRREYSQKDIETVWEAYLYKKMGLSYDQIVEILRGKNIPIRDQFNGMIQKYENQIEELRAIIDFIKYVKGVGYIPNRTDGILGSKNFKDYLVDLIEDLDKDRKLQRILDVTDSILSINDIDTLEKDHLYKIEKEVNEIIPDFTEEDREEYSLAFISLKDMLEVNPRAEETQRIISTIYSFQKKLCGYDLTVLDFVNGFITIFEHDSDIREVYMRLLGEKTCNYLCKALIEFLIIQEPKLVSQFAEQKL
ncbi:MAG: MerR family transcriptional regulator [Clostridia bacterium]|nr:MerR family transcriptional regulator [Clostridia bacterium]